MQILRLLAITQALLFASLARGASGSWNLDADGNWSNNANWTAAFPNATTDDATFGGVITADRIITLTQNINVRTINFNATKAYSFTGAFTLSLNLASGTGANFVQSGSGAVNFGSTTSIALANNSLWNGNGTGLVTVNGAVSGAFSLTKSGTFTLTLGGANTYTGATTISAGVLNIQNATGLGATAGGTTVSSGATLQLQGGITVGTETLNINGTGASGQTGALVNVSGTNNYGGLLTLAGAATLSSDLGTLNLTNTGTITGATFGLTLTGAGDGSISSIIGTTTGTLTKNGTGTWTLSGTGANTFTGITTVNDGTLQLNKTSGVNALAGALTVGDGTGSANSAVARWLATNEIPTATALSVNTDGLLDLNNFSNTVGTLLMTGGSITTGTGTLTLGGTVTGNAAATSATISGNLALGGNRTFTINDGAAAVDMDILAVVSGANNITKGGTGTMVLEGANTYTGTTTVSAGVLNIQNATGLGTTAGGTTVSSGATLQLQGGITVGTETLSIAGPGASGQTGALVNVSGTNNYGGLLTLTAATTLSSESGTLNLTNAGSITGNTFGLTLTGAGDGSISSIIGTTTGTLTKNGAGTWTLSGAGANTFTGVTTVNDGTLELNKTGGVNAYAGTLTVGDGVGAANSAVTRFLASNEAPATAVTVKSDGLFDLNGFTDTIAALTMTSGSVTTGTGTLTLGGTVTGNAAATSATISGNLALGGNRTFTINDGAAAVDMDILAVVSGANNITKGGTGTMVLEGTNTYTGTTTVSAGVLNIQNATGLGTTAGGTTVSSGATLQLQGGITVGTETLSIAGPGASGQTGALVNVSGTNNYGGLLTLTAATTLSSDSGTLNLTNAGTITGNTFGLTLTGAGDGSVSSIIGTTTGTLTKSGTGTWTLLGGNTYTGATTVSAGVLNIQHNTGLGTTATGTTVSSGATLQLQGGITVGNEGLNINGTGASGQTGALVNTSGTNNYGGLLTLAGATTISSDSGTLSLTNAGTITGATFGFTLAGAGNGSISSIIGTTTGGLTKTGTGTWTLSGVNTYTGITTLSDGVLSVATIGNGGAAGNLGQATNSATKLVFDGGTLRYTGATASTDRNFTINSGKTATFDITTNTLTLSGASTATDGALTKIGSGTLVLSGANAYTGATNINVGTLKEGNANVIADTSAVTVATSATYDLNSFSETIGSLAGGGTVTSGLGGALTLTAGGDDTSTLFSGVMQNGSGTVAFTKSGTGTLTFSGANTYTGATTISTGVLNIQNNAGLGTTAAGTTVSNGATLQLQGGITVGSETLNIRGTGASGQTGALVNVSGTNNYGGLLTLAGATTLSSDSGTVNFTNAGTITGATFGLTLTGSGNGSIASIIGTTTGSLTKTGSGTWTLSGVNTYTGATTVSGGTLTAAGPPNTGALGATSSITVNSGGTLLLAASDQINNSATIFLHSGTLAKGNGNEGDASNVGMGALTLTASNSHIDFGTGTAGVLNFASFAPSVYTLIIDNWTGTPGTGGDGSTDRLIFHSDQSGNLSSFSFTGFGPNATQIDLNNGFFEIVATPVPEPSTYAGGILALVGIGYLHRRQLRRLIKSKAARSRDS